MRKNTIAILLVFISGTGILISNNNGPAGDYSGAPLTSGVKGLTCGVSGCHVNNADLGGSVSISVFDQGQSTPLTKFRSGGIYTVKINVGSSSVKKGFEAVILGTGNTSVGTMSATGSGVKIKTYNNRVCAEHSAPSSLGTWTFTWTAPASGAPDSVVFYAAGNASNNNNTASGDDIRTNKTVLYLDPNAGINEVAMNRLFYPNPVQNIVNFREVFSEVQIADISGKTLNVAFNAESLDVSDLETGFYFLILKNSEKISLQKFQKL